ncbi:type 1 fimbrial protein [Pseudomonas edaphica]|uniref:Type 1 fimbrial protein n=1 Tax=Pseudomonas edaphica TaxID=2006980 RepID=A0ABY2U461_9PSED|nr:type 1 fimbrial protein [Pseudomonas edaphica]TLG90792.1 type 1 fimbrial protein [Pseudomonas edaphica]
MSSSYWPIGLSFVFAWSTACMAGYSDGQGTIQITGGVEEPGCSSNAPSSSRVAFTLNDCPSVVRGASINITHVEDPETGTLSGHLPGRIKLVSDSGAQGRYYNRQYQVQDNNGKIIRSGAYVITFTSP